MFPVRYLFALSLFVIALHPSALRADDAEENARKELQKIIELRLLSDKEITTLRDEQSKAANSDAVNRAGAGPEVNYLANVQFHRVLIAAGMREGLPLRNSGAILDQQSALVMQELSKELRKAGFVSLPTSSKQPERELTLSQWCDASRLDLFPGVPATLMQILQIEKKAIRLALVKQLAKTRGSVAGSMLANRATMDLSPDVRHAAVEALKKRPAKEYLPNLVKGLRYPWPRVAENAADALSTLQPKTIAPALCDLLDLPDPVAPIEDKRTKKMMVAELVRINHLRNCLLCHLPSRDAKDGLVRAAVSSMENKPVGYGGGGSGRKGGDKSVNFVRADVTFLRQDFSVNLPVDDVRGSSESQRFDFVVRRRVATLEEISEAKRNLNDYPQRQVVLRVLRTLTGEDLGKSASDWRELIGTTAKVKP